MTVNTAGGPVRRLLVKELLCLQKNYSASA